MSLASDSKDYSTPHGALGPTRKILWQEYFSLQKNQESKSAMIRIVFESIVQEIQAIDQKDYHFDSQASVLGRAFGIWTFPISQEELNVRLVDRLRKNLHQYK